MTAPATFVASGTFYSPTGTTEAGTVTFTPLSRSTPSGNVVPQTPIQVSVPSTGVLSQTLIQGVVYSVVEQFGSGIPVAYTIPGTGNIDLSSVSSLVTSQVIANAYQGAYSAGTTYQIGQIVSFNGQNWVLTAAAPAGSTPSTVSTYWLSLGGAAGAAYASKLGLTLPPGSVIGTLLGRQEVAAAYATGQAPATTDKAKVIVEQRGVPGLLDYVWMAYNPAAAQLDAVEQNGRIRIFLDNETTPSVDVSINDFFMYAEQAGPFDAGLVGRTDRNSGSNLAAYQAAPAGSAKRYLFAPFQSYCRVEYVNKAATPGNLATWCQAHIAQLAGPASGVAQTYKVFSNGDTLEPSLLPPTGDPGGPYTAGVNPTVPVTPGQTTICDISGSAGQLESVWVAVRTNGNNDAWYEGNFEITIDGAAEAQYLTTGGEDFFDGGFGLQAVQIGAQPAGQGGGDAQSGSNITAYRFFTFQPIQFANSLKIVWNVGQLGQGTWVDSSLGASGFAGVWLTAPPAVAYKKIAGVTPNVGVATPYNQDLFTTLTNGTALNGRAAPADGQVAAASAWNANAAWLGDGAGHAVLTGSAPFDPIANVQLAAGIGTDYWAETAVQMTTPTTTTGGAITNSATALVMGVGKYAALGSPAVPFDIQIDQEILQVSAADNTAANWTVARGRRTNDNGGTAGVAHASGAAVALMSGVPEMQFVARRSALSGGFADGVGIRLQRISNYNWLVKSMDGSNPVGDVKIDRGRNLHGVNVQLAILAVGNVIETYWKLTTETLWQPVTRWTTAVGVSGNMVIGFDYFGTNDADGLTPKGGERFLADYVKARQVTS